MKIEEMRRVGNLRKDGTARKFEDWLICVSDNWDKLLAVAQAAKNLSKRHNWHPELGECICNAHIEFKKALEELEKDDVDPWLKQLKLRPESEESLPVDDSLDMIDRKST